MSNVHLGSYIKGTKKEKEKERVGLLYRNTNIQKDRIERKGKQVVEKRRGTSMFMALFASEEEFRRRINIEGRKEREETEKQREREL